MQVRASTLSCKTASVSRTPLKPFAVKEKLRPKKMEAGKVFTAAVVDFVNLVLIWRLLPSVATASARMNKHGKWRTRDLNFNVM